MGVMRFKDSRRFFTDALSRGMAERGYIDPELYAKYEVKRGLRDVSGRGVLAGLTEIGDIRSYIIQDGEMIPIPGKLFYRGVDVDDLVNGFQAENRFGFEETAYLLLFGKLPDEKELAGFQTLLTENRSLPEDFVRDIIMKAPSTDLMNGLSRSILAMYSFDDLPDDTSVENVLRQCIQLITSFPQLAVYSYHTFAHYYRNQSLVIHSPEPGLNIAQSILHMLRPDSSYTEAEAKLLDLMLVLHAEHGGGNNSSFVTHVVTSTGTDTYSAVSSALGALKGPKHGGANSKSLHMMEDIQQYVRNWRDDEEILAYLEKLLNKEAFDHSGLIYGMGHAVYSMSDPRACILKDQAIMLAESLGLREVMNLYLKVEELAPQAIAKKRKVYKGVSANIDFYSGFVYAMLGIPEELFTPLFAVSRIVGWSAHRLEEIINNGKIIRPAYKAVGQKRKYIPMTERS